jgi:ribonuclease P protein component
MTVFSRARASGVPRIGLTVGRVLGGAVERNRIKRRMREAVRANLGAVTAAVDVVINPKKSVLTLEFAALRAEVGRALAAVQEKAGENRDLSLRSE